MTNTATIEAPTRPAFDINAVAPNIGDRVKTHVFTPMTEEEFRAAPNGVPLPHLGGLIGRESSILERRGGFQFRNQAVEAASERAGIEPRDIIGVKYHIPDMAADEEVSAAVLGRVTGAFIAAWGADFGNPTPDEGGPADGIGDEDLVYIRVL